MFVHASKALGGDSGFAFCVYKDKAFFIIVTKTCLVVIYSCS